jgi:GNAT superfamily N-acetyltransferase
MTFAPPRLARRIEEAECRLLADAAETVRRRNPEAGVLVRPIGGGVAVFTSPGAPWNKLAGLGFGGLDEGELAAVEREFERREAPLQVEFPSLGDNTMCATLTRRGYVLVGFENVLGLPLDRFAPRDPAPGVVVRPASPDEARTWTDAVITGFDHPDVQEGPKAHESFARETLERVMEELGATVGIRRYLASLDGAVAGGASLRLDDGIAQLCGAATLPAARRRGVQTTLLHFRLAEARREGCDIAVVTTQPGSKSQENVQRQGFALLYTRAILVRSFGSPGGQSAG